MKSKKFISISVIAVIIFSLIFGVIFNTNYVIIDGTIYKNDIKDISIYSLNDADIKSINKCTEIERMFLGSACDNLVSKFINFHNLSNLIIIGSEISSSDSEKISTFYNLRELHIEQNTIIDFRGFNNNTVSLISLFLCEVKNFKALSECSSLKKLFIYNSIISDNCIIVEDNKCVIKDSSVFTYFDYVEELSIFVDKIEDISGILEMDSLKEFTVKKGAISEDDKKLLEDKGISVIYYDK